MNPPLIAAVEAGGTHFNCAVGTGPGDLRLTKRFPTMAPHETLREMVDFFEAAARQLGQFSAIGFGSFGPIDLAARSETYGYIMTTPKPGWQFTDVLGPLRDCFHVPIGFDTDVNAAALGEFTWGAGRTCDPLVYVTVGTGIGGGVLVGGKPLHGAMHPEIGHMHVPAVQTEAPRPEGVCPFHGGHCLEGLISGTAIAARWGIPAELLPPEHDCWGEFAMQFALGLVNLTLTLSPQRIILGGGVMHQTHLFPMIRAELQRLLNDYLHTRELMEGIDQYVVPPELGDEAGVLGAIALGRKALAAQAGGVTAGR
jgi:fructokinase